MKTTNFIKSLFLITLFIIGVNFVLTPVIASPSIENISPKIIDTGDEKFDRIFREGRELMDKEEWAKAVAKFNEIVCDCPEKKYVDAAFYWLAYCYRKQKMFKEAGETVDRLLKNFPESSWADDARVLKFQIYSPRALTNISGQGGIRTTPAPGVYSSGQAKVLTEAALAETYISSQQTQLDREDEIKLAAFQSLLGADIKKGIEVMGNILRADSKASETLKREVLRTLRNRHFGWGGFSTFPSYQVAPTTVITQLNPILRDTLVKSYQNESNTKIRTEIIYSIANINDDQSIIYLGQLYPAESNKELKFAIINSFGNSFYGFFTPVAEGTALNKAVIEESVATATVKKSQGEPAVATITQNVSPVRKLRFDKLMEIFRVEKDLELRRAAFSNIQRFSGWSSSDGMIQMISQLYDAESDEKFKTSIIYSFGHLTKNAQAINKLLEIAKNDKSDKMRLEAIRALRNNNSPEVLKFLEDLIK